MFNRFKLNDWESTNYDDKILITADAYIKDKYRIFVRMESKIYEDSFKGEISLDETHWDEELQSFIIDKRHFVGYLCSPDFKGLPLKMAKSIAKSECRKIHKIILKNSFTK